MLDNFELGGEQFALAIFSPDATTTGLYERGVQCIEGAGLRILDGLWVRLPPSLTNTLYRANRAKGRTHFDDLVDLLFSLDWSLALRIGPNPAGSMKAETLHQRLKDLKGPSDPSRQQPGQIRKELGAENRLLNYVHTSDSYRDSLREFSVVASGESLRAFEAGRVVEPASLLRRKSILLEDVQGRFRSSVDRNARGALPVALEASHYNSQDAECAIKWLRSKMAVDIWDQLILFSNAVEAR